MDYPTRQGIEQQIEILKSQLDEIDCERVIITKEIERLKIELGEST